MNAMLDPRIVAARTHGAALGEQTDVAAPDLITPISHGCLIMLAIATLPLATYLLPEASPLARAGTSGEGRVLS
jgi:hypothetical protein